VATDGTRVAGGPWVNRHAERGFFEPQHVRTFMPLQANSIVSGLPHPLRVTDPRSVLLAERGSDRPQSPSLHFSKKIPAFDDMNR